MVPNDLVVIGMPSSVGGADTELYDQIKCWSMMGIKVHLVPTTKPRNCVDLSNLNVVVHDIKDYNVCDGQYVIGYCNPYFLKDIKVISKLAKDTMWASCMCFNFKEEIEAAYNGLIGSYIYQTYHQYQKCAGHLLKASKHCDFNKYLVHQINPYFDRTPFQYRPNKVKPFKIGRISRGDPAKFGKDQFKIYKNAGLFPILIVGWNDRVAKKFKDDLPWINDQVNQGFIKLVPEGGMNNVEFFNSINILSMTTDTYENLPRVGFEALASGCALVPDSQPGWFSFLDASQPTMTWCANSIDDFGKTLVCAWKTYWGSDLWTPTLDHPPILDRYDFKQASTCWELVFDYLKK